MLSDEQEVAIVSIVLTNNEIRLRDLREQIIADQITSAGINTISISRGTVRESKISVLTMCK